MVDAGIPSLPADYMSQQKFSGKEEEEAPMSERPALSTTASDQLNTTNMIQPLPSGSEPPNRGREAENGAVTTNRDGFEGAELQMVDGQFGDHWLSFMNLDGFEGIDGLESFESFLPLQQHFF